MAITDYESLKDAFVALSHRSDSDDYIDTLQGLSERRIANDLRTQEMEINVTLVCDEEFESLPSNFLEATKINDEDVDANGYFDSYEIVGKTIKIKPVASASNVVNIYINYYAEQSALSNNSDTHDALIKNSNVYLAALMLEYAIMSKDELSKTTWLTYYTDAITQSNNRANKIKYPGGSLQVRSV